MILLQRRMFLELMGNALTTSLLLLFIMLLVASVKVLGLGMGLGIADFVRLVPANMVAALDLVLPIAVLVAVVLTYGRAAADNEIDTLRASGVHPLHVVTPGLLFGAIMSLLLLVAMDYGKPYAERATQQARKDIPVAQLLAAKLATGEPLGVGGGTLLWAPSIDEFGNATDLRLQKFDEEGHLLESRRAARARIYVDADRSTLVLELVDLETMKGPDISGDMVLEKRLEDFEGNMNMRALTTPQLAAWLARNERDGLSRGCYAAGDVAAELNFRLSGAAACLAFVLLGIPVALRQRKTDRLGAFLVAFLLSLFLYYPSLKVAKALAESGTLDSGVAAWLAHVVLLVVALGYSRRVARG